MCFLFLAGVLEFHAECVLARKAGRRKPLCAEIVNAVEKGGLAFEPLSG